MAGWIGEDRQTGVLNLTKTTMADVFQRMLFFLLCAAFQVHLLSFSLVLTETDRWIICTSFTCYVYH